MNCRECAHCGQSRGNEIRCEHPSWEEETHLRYIHPTFAEECSDFERRSQDRWILLNADDVHQEGDEVWDRQWIPIKRMHIGDKVGEDSTPCRRRAV